MLVEHRPDTAERLAGDDRVPDPQRSALDEDGGHRAAAAVQPAFDRHALGLDVGRGTHVQRRVGGEDDRLEQPVDVGAVAGGDVDEHGVTAVLLGDQPVLGELPAYLLRVRPLLVDLVDGDDDGHVGGLGVVERLDRLRLDTVVGGDHQHHDVGHLRTTGTHRGERLMTRGVNEGDLPLFAVDLRPDLVGPDVLGDPTGLAADDVRLPDRVEQLRLAVVDVAHDCHDRRPRPQLDLVAVGTAEGQVEALQQLLVLVLGADDLHLVPERHAEQLQGLVRARLRRGHHLAELGEHDLDERALVGVDLVREVGQGGAPGQSDDLPVATRDHRPHAGGFQPALPFLPLRALGLALTPRAATATGTERAGRGATAAAPPGGGTTARTTATGTPGGTRAPAGPGAGRTARRAATGEAAATARTPAAGSSAATTTGSRTATAATATGARPPAPGGAGGEHARIGPRATGTAGTRRHLAGRRPRATGTTRTRRYLAGRRPRAGTRATRAARTWATGTPAGAWTVRWRGRRTTGGAGSRRLRP